MKFQDKESARNYVVLKYKKDEKMVILKYSPSYNRVLNNWYKAKNNKSERIIIEYDENKQKNIYYYYDKFKLFPNEDDKIYISESEFFNNYNKQYFHWLIEEIEKDSDSYVLDEYITKEQIQNRNAIFKHIAECIF